MGIASAPARQLTIEEYRQEQGLMKYDELGRGWRQSVIRRELR